MTRPFTDPSWPPPDLPERGWTSPTAGTAPSTVTPPAPAPEPEPDPHPSDHRLAAIERACATLQRQALTIAEWAQYIAHQARKARGQ